MNEKKAKRLRKFVMMATAGKPGVAYVPAKPGSGIVRVHPQTTRGLYLALKRTEE
jgi:hypothetical protein